MDNIARILALIAQGSGGGSGGTTDYDDLIHKPSIGGVTLSGNLTLFDLGYVIDNVINPQSSNPVANSVIANVLANLSYNDLTNKPSINNVTLTGNTTLKQLGLNAIWVGTSAEYEQAASSIEEGTAVIITDDQDVDNVPTQSSTNLVYSGGVYAFVTQGLGNKVDKVQGKGLSTEDYTTAEKTKLAGLTNDYTDLANKPQINGTTLTGDKSSADLGLLPASTRYGASISANKYMEPVTGKLKIDTILKDQNGNAMATITSDQPVVDVGCDSSGLLVTYPSARASVSLSPAMSGKVDKVQGKGLSTEDYTTAEKNKLANIDANIDSTPTSGSTHPVSSGGVYDALGNKVNKVSGKGLSTEDFTAMYKAWLDVSMQSPTNHNGIFRGKDLTNIYTIDEMYGMINAGTFDDLFLGDHFTKSITTDIMTRFTGETFDNGTDYYEMGGEDPTTRTWTITEDAAPQSGKTYTTKQTKTENITLMYGGFNCYYNTGDTAFTTHHAILIPKAAGFATSAKMNSASTTAGGYYGSDMHQITLPCYAKSLKTMLGNHLLAHKTWLTTGVNATTPSMGGAGLTGAASASAWETTELQLMNEAQIYGSTVWSSSAYDVGIDNEKLPVFNFITPVHFSRATFWLRSVVSSTYFANCSSSGYASLNIASTAYSVRPLIIFG